MDDEPSLRRPLLPRGPALIVVAVAAVVLGAMVVLPRVLAWRDARDRAALEEAAAPYERDGDALEAQLQTRLAPLLAARDSAAPPAPARCPDTVAGDVALVQRPWLAYALHQTDYPHGENLASPAFAYLAHTTTPGFGETAQLDVRNRAYRALLAAPYVAVVAPTHSDDIKPTGEATFEGGRIEGSLAIYDVARGTVACATELASQPDFVISVRQDSVDSERHAQRSAQSQAIASSFWTAAAARLAELAPHARLITP